MNLKNWSQAKTSTHLNLTKVVDYGKILFSIYNFFKSYQLKPQSYLHIF